MRTPGFTGEASLGRSGTYGSYQNTTQWATGVNPAQQIIASQCTPQPETCWTLCNMCCQGDLQACELAQNPCCGPCDCSRGGDFFGHF
ncbi:MAG: hypothetical protein V8K32_02490 [Candidatus Electrothrix gigas]